MSGGGRHRRDDQEKQSVDGRDAGGGVAAVVVAEAHLDVVPADAVLFVALVRDLLATGVLHGRPAERTLTRSRREYK